MIERSRSPRRKKWLDARKARRFAATWHDYVLQDTEIVDGVVVIHREDRPLYIFNITRRMSNRKTKHYNGAKELNNSFAGFKRQVKGGRKYSRLIQLWWKEAYDYECEKL